jgi:transglycosylase-like protein
MRARAWSSAGLLVLSGGAALGVWASTGAIERRLADEVARRGAPLGLTAGAVHFSWTGPVRLDAVTVVPAAGGRLTLRGVRVGWGWDGGRDPRAHVRHLSLEGAHFERDALVVDWPAADLDVLAWNGGAGAERIRVRQGPAGGQMEAGWRTDAAGREASLSLERFDLSGMRVAWGADPVLAPGSWTGRLSVSGTSTHLATSGALAAEGVRVSLPRGLALGDGAYGAPTSVALSWTAERDAAAIEVRRLIARIGGLELDGHGQVTDAGGERMVDLELDARSDLGAALQTTALQLPAALTAGPSDRLGVASFDVSVHGPLARPALLRIVPHLRYASTPQVMAKLEFLRRPFRYHPAEAEGVTLDVRAGAPDFVPLGEVPPLFLRTLLISEDAGFYGHPGVDVAEIPLAWTTNLERGTSARGASTITQQLVKNLFLSKDKSYGRKLEEAALALLVDAAVPKARILEIYVNVIEWGPNIFGLVPAARHYFGKAPADLTPKEMAFLVSLIPSPVRYHQAHTAGRLGPGMEQLVATLLAKLKSVDAIDDQAYEEARAEELHFAPESVPGVEPAGTD